MTDIHYITGFYNDDQKIFAKCINYRSLEYSIVSTPYSFLSIAVIERNHINHFMDAIKLFHSICDNSNGIFMIHNYEINGSTLDIYRILVKHQGYNVDDCWKGVLVIFKSDTLKNCVATIDYMKSYIRGKPSYGAVQDKFDLHLSLQMQMFLLNYTSEMPHTKHLTNQINRTEHLYCGYDNINLEDIFSPCGFYKIEDNAERFTFVPTIKDSFIDKLPIIILDIETVANDMNIVPMGVTKDQRISSLVLKVIYFNVNIYYIMYTCTDRYVSEAKKFDECFARRYTDVKNNIFVNISSYKNDSLLLEAFINLYSSGKILEMLTRDKYYPHIFTGHNILEYDLPVMANIMKRNRMHNLFDKNVSIENVNRPPVVLRFHRSAIVIDLFQVAKRNMLSAVGYSLKAMAKAASSDDNKQKYDLNSVNIRKWYILESYISNEAERNELAKYFNLQPNIENDLRIVESTGEHNFNDLVFDPMYIDGNKFQSAHIKVRVLDTLEKILIYNIGDCSAVGNILFSNNYFNLITKFAKIFNMDMEAASYWGNSARLFTCILSQQINFHHLLGVTDRTDHVLVLKSTENFLKGIGLESYVNRIEPAVSWTSTATSKAYTGALNYAKVGLMKRVFGIDFVSYYPNLLCARRMSMHRISQVNCRSLLRIPEWSFLCSLVQNGLLTLYCAEDVNPEKSLVFSYRGREIAHKLSIADLEKYNNETQGEGKVIIYVEESQPDAFYRIAQSLLARRGEAKKELKETKNKIKNLHQAVSRLGQDIESDASMSGTDLIIAEKQTSIGNLKKEIEHLNKLKNVQDATQLCLKIVVNSLYGVLGANNFAFSHVPMAALITLLGRAKLALCCRLAVYYYYREILTNIDYRHLCYMRHNFEGIAELTVNNMMGKPVTLEYLEKNFKYLLEIAPFNNKAEVIMSFFDCDSLSDDIFQDTDIIVYTDTDGILFTNFLNINCDLVLDNINKFIVEVFPTDCLILEADKKYDIIGILGKKAYYMANASYTLINDNDLLFAIPSIDQIQLFFQKIKCKHNGYERNAPLHIKRIYNYIVSLTFICNEFDVELRFLEIFFDIFSYMKLLNQYKLSVQIPLNEHSDKTTNLAQYIERNTTTYKGSVETMFVLDHTNISADVFKTLIEWETDQPPIHYVKTMKTHFKTFWRILNMCKYDNRTTLFLQRNMELFLKKIQHYAAVIYCMWGAFNEEFPEIQSFKTFFQPQQYPNEKTMQCFDNVTVDEICTKKRNNESVSFSYDIHAFELPVFVCEKVQRQIALRYERKKNNHGDGDVHMTDLS